VRRPWAVVVCALLPAMASGQEQDGPRTRLKGYAAAEPRLFPQDARFPQQDWFSGSVAAELELRHEWDGRSKSLAVTPFIRLDQHDASRTHFDVREAALRLVSDDYELVAGASKVFWGVTESQHLVDIVNQTDLVENPDGEDKLGQLMVNLTLARSWGTLNLFVLPGSRKRTFPGHEGRLRPSVVVDADAAVFEAGQWHTDFAVRWSKTVGVVDLGVSHFYGTSREPRLQSEGGSPGEEKLTPYYELIHQTGLDAQLTVGQWLWKLEAIRRTGQGPEYLAATAGFEYTFTNAFGTGIGLGLLAEYLYDDRGNRASTPWQDDVFAGVRLTANDTQSTELLAGVIVDRRSGARAWSLEASRRLSDHGKVGLEARSFSGSRREDPLFELRRDGYVQLEFSYHF
jgi:hypothetical protein